MGLIFWVPVWFRKWLVNCQYSDDCLVLLTQLKVSLIILFCLCFVGVKVHWRKLMYCWIVLMNWNLYVFHVYCLLCILFIRELLLLNLFCCLQMVPFFSSFHVVAKYASKLSKLYLDLTVLLFLTVVICIYRFISADAPTGFTVLWHCWLRIERASGL